MQVGKSYTRKDGYDSTQVFKCTALTPKGNAVVEYKSSLGRIVEVVYEKEDFHRFILVPSIVKTYQTINSSGHLLQKTDAICANKAYRDHGYLEWVYEDGEFKSIKVIKLK